MFRRALILKPFSTASVEIFKDKFHGLEGIFPGAVGGGVADIGTTAWVRASFRWWR